MFVGGLCLVLVHSAISTFAIVSPRKRERWLLVHTKKRHHKTIWTNFLQLALYNNNNNNNNNNSTINFIIYVCKTNKMCWRANVCSLSSQVVRNYVNVIKRNAMMLVTDIRYHVTTLSLTRSLQQRHRLCNSGPRHWKSRSFRGYTGATTIWFDVRTISALKGTFLRLYV